MNVAISNTFPAGPVSEPEDAPKATTPVAPVAHAAADTVKLSQSAQIHALKQQGQGASQIANLLGVTVSSVDSVLGIALAKTPAPVVAAAPVPPPAPAPVPVPAAPVAKA